MSHGKMRVTCPVNLYVFPVVFKTKRAKLKQKMKGKNKNEKRN